MLAKNAKTSSVKDVDDYLARVPENLRAPLETLRETIRLMVPEATEVISYAIPTFKYRDRMLVSYAAFREHCSFFPGAGPIEVHQKELKAFQTSKGTIRFSPAQPLSATLVKKLVKTRIKLNDEQMKRRAAKKAGRKR